MLLKKKKNYIFATRFSNAGIIFGSVTCLKNRMSTENYCIWLDSIRFWRCNLCAASTSDCRWHIDKRLITFGTVTTNIDIPFRLSILNSERMYTKRLLHILFIFICSHFEIHLNVRLACANKFSVTEIIINFFSSKMSVWCVYRLLQFK